MASKQRRQQKSSNTRPSVETMRTIFEDSQRLDKHQTCLQGMTCLQEIHSKTNQLITNFYKELVRNIKYTLWVHDWRSPYGQNSINFIINYMLDFGHTGDEDNEELRHEFIDTVLEDVVIPYTNSKKAECRINACHFIRRLSDELEDINDDIYEKIRKALLDRSVDRIASVRAAAILALHRFQDIFNANDVVIQAIQFHLNSDPDSDVRHNSLKAMAAVDFNLVRFIEATLDVKDFIRRTAYLQISEKLTITNFKIDGRLTILKNGLKDRSPAVRKVVESVLIPSWVKFCNNNLIQLLVLLDIQTDIQLIEKMLDIYFKHLNKELSKDSHRTKFIELVDEFRTENLAKERVFSVSINVENVFLWRYLCEFCKTNKIETKVFNTTENRDQNPTDVQTDGELPLDSVIGKDDSIPEEAADELREQKVDLFDSLVPDVPYFCTYVENFLKNVIKEELNITDALDYEFIFNQFMKVALLLDIEDDAQRKTLIKTMHTILVDSDLSDKFHNYITPIMKSLAKKGFVDNQSYLEFTVELISEIFAPILTQTSEENETIVDDSTRELEKERDQLMADIEKCKIDAQKLENEEKLSEAEEILKKMDALELNVKSLRQKITINTLAQSLSQSSQTSQTSNSASFSDHPKTQMRCLHIFSGCLEFGVFNEVNAVMQTHIEKVCLPGILSDSSKIRCVATRCLGLVCLTSPQYFKKYLHLLIEIFSKDIDSIKLIGLQSIFDSLCEHGINIFEDKTTDSSGGDELRVEPFDDNDDDFITSLKKFFSTQLDSENDEIRQIAAQGVSKLLIHCRMYSPELLSKLIIIWFTPNENPIIVQFIGDFLRLYSLAESQGVIVGQSALEEAFVITLQTIYDNSLRLNCDNLIKFFLKLIADESHVKLAEDLVKRMVDTNSADNKLIEDYLLSAVCQLNLIEMEAKELKRFEDNICIIEERLEKSKSKKVKQKLSAIKKNIENRSQQLSADSAFADDFRSVDENNDDSDIFDRSQDLVNDKNDKQVVGSDSDADSFRTCPESPLQKRRRISDICEPNESLNPTISSELPVNEDMEVEETVVSEIPITEEEDLNEMNTILTTEVTSTEDNETEDIINIIPEIGVNEDMDIDVNIVSEQLFPEINDLEVNETIASDSPSGDDNPIDESVAQNNQTNEELSQTLNINETLETESDQQID